MPISGDIYNAFAPKVQSPLEVQNGLMSADAQRAALQAHQMQMVQQQRAMQQDDALRQATIASKGDPAAMRAALAQGGNYAALQKHDLNQATIAKEGAATAKDKAEAFHKTTVEMARQFGAVNPNDNQGLSAIIASGVKAGVIPEDSIPKILEQAGEAGTPQRAQWHAQQKAQAMSEVERQQRDLEALKQRELGRHNLATEGNQTAQLAEQQRTHKVNEGIAGGHLKLAREKAATEQAGGGLEGFTPAAIEAAAGRYNLDGTLPPMGMGKAGTQGRQAILNRAAELAGDKSGIEQRVSQLDNKSAAAALTKLTSQKTMVSAFEKNANANADLALDLSEKNDRTNVNILNKWIQAGRKGTGSPEAAQFNAANETFVNEYAKIMSGSMGNTAVSDSARAHAHEIIATANSKEQYRAVMGTLRQEMKNRMKGFEDEEGALKSRLRGQPAEAPAAAPSKVVKFGDLK